jgi:hypothetical protein
MQVRFWLSGLIAAAAIVTAVVASTQQMALEYVAVGRVTDSAMRGARLKVTGRVVPKTTQVEHDTQGRTVLRFEVEGDDRGPMRLPMRVSCCWKVVMTRLNGVFSPRRCWRSAHRVTTNR